MVEKSYSADKTLGLVAAESMLAKLFWEWGALRNVVAKGRDTVSNGREEVYITLNAAITVNQLFDWVQYEIDKREDGWQHASLALGHRLRNKRDLLEYGRLDTAIRACRQIATASKHVNLTHPDSAVRADGMMGVGGIFLSDGDGSFRKHTRQMLYVISGDEQMSVELMISRATVWWSVVFAKLKLDSNPIVGFDDL